MPWILAPCAFSDSLSPKRSSAARRRVDESEHADPGGVDAGVWATAVPDPGSVARPSCAVLVASNEPGKRIPYVKRSG